MQIKKVAKIPSKEMQKLEIVVPLEYLSKFWRTLDMPLINCEVSLILTWFGNCVLADITTPTARAPQGEIQQDQQYALQQVRHLK